MKKLIGLIVLVILMIGCSNPYRGQTEEITENYKIVVIDSCEYIWMVERLAHKGNCKFCIERNKKIK